MSGGSARRATASAEQAIGTAGQEVVPLLTRSSARPVSLPVQPGPLIGRVRDLAEVQRLLVRDDIGLVTLIGAGGSGKTRLAIAAATDVATQFVDGACFVALAPISDPDLVTHAICDALGVREAGRRPLIERLAEYLRTRQLVLVLDNFEHVLSAGPRVVELLERCPRLKVLVTSRAVLHVPGEYAVTVAPLSVPPRGPHPDPAQLAQYEAVQLFVARARAASPGFALTRESAPTVAEICRRLDGLPLAIELAAAHARSLSPPALLARLDRRLSLLVGGPVDRPSHQQTLRGTIDWSYELLDEAGQALFRRLAVFVGGFTLGAGSWVMGDASTSSGSRRARRSPPGPSGTGSSSATPRSRWSLPSPERRI